MTRNVNYNGSLIEYELTRKRVKNINLRIKTDGRVCVSANTRVPVTYIDDFVLRRGDFILSAVERFLNVSKTQPEPLYSAEEFIELANEEFERTFTLFKSYSIDKPLLRFKRTKSRWGSCNYSTGVITLSTNLIYCTEEQIKYVIIHEFTHLLVHDHSKAFYSIVERFCPDYKRIRKEMNNIVLR